MFVYKFSANVDYSRVMAARNRKQRSQATVTCTEQNGQFTPLQGGSKPRGCRCCSKLLVALLLLYTAVPFLLRFSPRLQAELVYFNFIDFPLFVNLSDPESFGLTQTRSFFLQHPQPNGCRLGVWQILPSKYDNMERLSDSQFPKQLSDGSSIILYLHGNTGNRGMSARVDLYKYLAKTKGYHVVAFDYRGYGDSDCSTSEKGLLEDGHLMWDWIRNHAPNARVYLWGHSLGTAASTSLAEKLTNEEASIAGLILDAPFTSILDAGYNHPFSILFWPIMDQIFKPYVIDQFVEKHASIDRIKNIRCPILIAHSHNDFMIPFHLGKKLYETAVATRKPQDIPVRFVDCGDSSHEYNYNSEALKEALDDFIVSV